MKIALLGVMAAALFVAAAPAYAAAETPHAALWWGAAVADFLQSATPSILSLVGIALTYVAARVGGPLGWLLKQKFVEAELDKAVLYGLAQSEGAVKGEKITVGSANSALAAAFGFFNRTSPKAAKSLGVDLFPHLVATLSKHVVLPAESSAATLVAKRAA